MASLKELVSRGYTTVRRPEWHNEAFLELRLDGTNLSDTAVLYDSHNASPASPTKDVNLADFGGTDWEPIGKSDSRLALELEAAGFEVDDLEQDRTDDSEHGDADKVIRARNPHYGRVTREERLEAARKGLEEKKGEIASSTKSTQSASSPGAPNPSNPRPLAHTPEAKGEAAKPQATAK